MSKKKGFWASLKEAFDSSEEELATEAMLEDGTAIVYDGELKAKTETEEGTIVKVVIDGVEAPLAEGEHNLGGDLAGQTIVVDATGMVIEIKETVIASSEDETEAEEQEAMAKFVVAEFKKVLERVKFLETENKSLKSDFNKLVDDVVKSSLDKKKFAQIQTNVNDKLKRIIK